MKRIGVTTIVLYIFYSLSAQVDTGKLVSGMNEKRFKIYRTWITLHSVSMNYGSGTIQMKSYSPTELEGVLYEINDSSISVSNSLIREDYSTGKFKLSKINFNNIDIVKTRMKNNALRVALFGALTGFVGGGLIGLISGDDPPGLLSYTAGEKALAYGLVFGVGGAGIGALEGLVKINIPINGSMENFKRNKSRLKKYSIR